MARKVSGYAPGVERVYTPEAYGNRLDLDPIKVWIKQPTEADKRRVTSSGDPLEIVSGKDGSIRSDDGTINFRLDLSRIIARQALFVSGFVAKVEGYTSANGKPITNGAELVEHGESDIIAEVATEIEKQLSLTETERKNSGEPSGSTPAAMPLSGGIVPSASSTDCVSSVTAPGVTLDFDTSHDTGIDTGVVQKAG